MLSPDLSVYSVLMVCTYARRSLKFALKQLILPTKVLDDCLFVILVVQGLVFDAVRQYSVFERLRCLLIVDVSWGHTRHHQAIGVSTQRLLQYLG